MAHVGTKAGSAATLYTRGVLAIGVALLALVLSGCPLGGGDGPESQVIIALFGTEDDLPAVAVGYGHPYDVSLTVPPGEYYQVAVYGDGLVIDLGVNFTEKITGAKASGDESDPEYADAIRTLANFLSEVELARLDALSVASDGLSQPLFGADVAYDADATQRLYSAQVALGNAEGEVMEALSVIDGRLQARAPAKRAGAAGGAKELALDKLYRFLPDFLNRVRTTPDRLRPRLMSTIEQIRPADQQDVFSGMPGKLRGGAETFDEWASAVQRGDHDEELGAIQGYLHVAAGDAMTAAGQTTGRIVAEEAGPLVASGGDLAISTFGRVPHVKDITKWSKDWEKYTRLFYNNPEKGLEQIATGPYLKFVKDQIKKDLRKLMPNATEKVVDSLAGQLATRVVTASVQGLVLGPSGALSGSPPLSEAEPTPTLTSEEWVDLTVEAIAQRLLQEGFRGIEVAVVTDDLRLCLLDAMAAGLSQDEALSACAYIIEQESEPTPTAPPPPTEPPAPPATEPPPPPVQPPPAEPTPCPPDSFSPLCGLQHR